MARGVPTFFSGSIAQRQITDTEPNQLDRMFNELETRITSYQSGGTDAWELYDTISSTPGSQDKVFRSVGDRTLVGGAGDARLFIRLTQTATTTLRFLAYQDWSTLSSTGTNQTTAITWTSFDLNDEVTFFGVSNEYEFTIKAKQSGNLFWAGFGSPVRDHIPQAANGVAFLTAPATAGSSVVISIDRDITANIVHSGEANGPQKVWIYNITAAGNALESGSIELVDVEANAAGTITLTIANSYVTGAIVGLDPSPMYQYVGVNTVDPTDYWTNSPDTAGPTSGLIEPFISSFSEAVADPRSDSLYPGSKCFAVSLSNWRGTHELITAWGAGVNGEDDLMTPNFDTAERHKILSSSLANSGYFLGIGPGAT